MINVLMFDRNRDEIKDIEYWPCEILHQQDDDVFIESYDMVNSDGAIC